MFPAYISELLFWLAAAICVIAQVAVVRAALAGRTPGTSPSPVARFREFFWVLLPAALLALLLGWTWSALPTRAAAPSLSGRLATAGVERGTFPPVVGQAGAP